MQQMQLIYYLKAAVLLAIASDNVNMNLFELVPDSRISVKPPLMETACL
jgi:hypothetical protein